LHQLVLITTTTSKRRQDFSVKQNTQRNLSSAADYDITTVVGNISLGYHSDIKK